MKIVFESYILMTSLLNRLFNGLVNFRNGEIWYRYVFYLLTLIMSLYISLESFEVLYSCYSHYVFGYDYTIFLCNHCSYIFNVDVISGGLIFLTGTITFMCLAYV